MKQTTLRITMVVCMSLTLINCAGGDAVENMGQAKSSTYNGSSTIGSGGTAYSGVQSSTSPISLYNIPAALPVDCTYFTPDAAQNTSDDILLWLSSIQASGITLAENYAVARSAGYSGPFGKGQHLAWLAQDPSRQAAFTAAVSAFANQIIDGYGTRIQHHQIRRAAGYRGLFLCGGDICWQQGQCDNLGRKLNGLKTTPVF